MELEEILQVHPELLKILKKFPYFVEYVADYAFPPKEAVFRGFKFRSPLLLAGGNDGLVRVWRYKEGKFQYLKTLGEENGKFPAYEVYKEHLFYSSGSSLVVYYLPSGKEVAKVDIGNPITALNLQEEGLFLYKRIGNIAIKQRVDIEEGKVLFGPADPIAPTQVESGESDTFVVEKKLLKLKGGKIFLLSGAKKEEKITFERENVFKIPYPINDLYLIKTSAIVATDQAPPQIVDIESGRIVGKFDIPINHTYRIRKNPIKQEVALSHSDNLISVWNLETLQPLKILESYFIDVLALDYSPDGKYLAAAGEGRDINVWDANEWRMLKDIDLPVEGTTALAFSPDGKYLAAGGGDYNIYLIDTSDWSIKETLSYHQGLISDLAFTPDGKCLVSASWDGDALLWEVETKEVKKILESSNDRIWKVAFSPDGKYLAIADWMGKVSLIETAKWETVNTFIDQSGVTALFFGRDRLLIGRKDGTIEVIAIKREESYSDSAMVDITKNPAQEAEGITLFEGNLLVYTKGKKIAIWNSSGEKVFSAKASGGLTEVENLREPRAEIKILPSTYIVRKDGYFFGSKGWEDYVNILKGLEVVEDKAPFLKEITKRELLQEL